MAEPKSASLWANSVSRGASRYRCADELAALRETKTYVPVKKGGVDPHNVVGCWWVFTLKKKVDGSIE